MEKLSSSLSYLFPEGSEELEVLESTYKIITSSYPSVASDAKSHLIVLDQCRVKLSTLYYSLCRAISRLKDGMESTYNSSYVRLVKLGRPSKDAIEAEIKATNPEYSGVAKKISDYEDVKNLVNMYIRCVDSSKSTVIEILRNIYRID